MYNSSPIVFLLLNYKKETTTSLTKHILQRKIVIYEPRSLVSTKLLDITTRDVVPIFTKKGLKFSYLLEACGDVLGLVRHIKAFDLDIEVLFEVYRLEDNGTTPCWTKMNDGIGDRMLILDCMGGVGFCLNANHFPGLKGNCIYFQESNQIYYMEWMTPIIMNLLLDDLTSRRAQHSCYLELYFLVYGLYPVYR